MSEIRDRIANLDLRVRSADGLVGGRSSTRGGDRGGVRTRSPRPAQRGFLELGRAAASSSAVITAADSTEGITPNWTPWRVRGKRTNLADAQPDSASEMAHDESDYLS